MNIFNLQVVLSSIGFIFLILLVLILLFGLVFDFVKKKLEKETE